jgi:hypothetical protein
VIEAILIRYEGFQIKGLDREYTFQVRRALDDPCQFTLLIANEAFDSHRARYQDAPEICSLKLHRELATAEVPYSVTNFRVTDAELDDYHRAHAPKPLRFPNQYKAKQAY